MTSFWTIALIAALQQQPIDGTALNFTIDHDSVTVQIGRWKLKSNKAEEMNNFVDIHLKAIDPNKIFIYGDAAAKYPSFRPVIEVLKKHDWMKFKMMPISPKANPPQKKLDTSQLRQS